MKIDAGQLSHQELNDQLRMSREQNIIIENCLGQRYLASGSRGKKVTVTGTPGMRWDLTWMARRSTFTAMSRKPPAIL